MSKYQDMSVFNVIDSIKREYEGKSTIHLVVEGERAGDMIVHIYGDDTTKNMDKVEWENFQYIQGESVFNEILTESDKWDVTVYIINQQGKYDYLR